MSILNKEENSSPLFRQSSFDENTNTEKNRRSKQLRLFREKRHTERDQEVFAMFGADRFRQNPRKDIVGMSASAVVS